VSEWQPQHGPFATENKAAVSVSSLASALIVASWAVHDVHAQSGALLLSLGSAQ
jgi:hypothetical protein